jgi:hypothetical protein
MRSRICCCLICSAGGDVVNVDFRLITYVRPVCRPSSPLTGTVILQSLIRGWCRDELTKVDVPNQLVTVAGRQDGNFSDDKTIEAFD